MARQSRKAPALAKNLAAEQRHQIDTMQESLERLLIHIKVDAPRLALFKEERRHLRSDRRNQRAYRPQKITFAEMRDRGVRGVLIYCAGYRCSHSIAVSADRRPDDLRLSDIGNSRSVPADKPD